MIWFGLGGKGVIGGFSDSFERMIGRKEGGGFGGGVFGGKRYFL